MSGEKEGVPTKEAQNTGEALPETSPPDVERLTREFNRERDRRRHFEGKATDLELKLKAWEGLDPEEIRGLIEEKNRLEEEIRKKDPTKIEEHWQRKTEGLRKELDTKVKELSTELEKLRKENRTLTVTDKVMGKIGGKFNEDAHRFIKREIEERAERDDDGNIIFRDENGEVLYSRTSRSLPMTAEEFGDYLAEQYPSLARPTGTSGARDVTPGQKVNGRLRGVPQTWAELQALGAAGREVLDRLKREDPAAVQKILRTMTI